MSWLCRLRWSTALTTGLRRYSDVTSSSGGAAVRRAQLLALKGGRRLPTVKRSRRQLGISMVNPVAETAETRLSCSDPQQQATMQEMFRSGRREWDSAFEQYGRISNPEPALTTAILALAEKCGRVTEALDLYTELRWKKELSARMCNHVIRLAGRVHSALARGVLADMKNCQLEPNVYNYLALLELYKTERNANGARELWKQMRQEAVAGSDEVMLCSVMSVVAKSGDVKGTEALMLEAEATFPIITPHFNCCLDACHVAGDADSAFRILEEMQAASCRPDVISYNSSLGALDRAGRGKEDRDRLLQEMAKNEVKPNELFVDRHICSVLGIQKGAQVSAEWISRLPEEAVKEVREILRQTEVARLRQSKLVREVRSLLGANVSTTASTDESSNESGAKRSAEALGGAATDWVKVLGKDEAGSIIEYFWDRSSGRTQWEPPDGPVHETVSA